MGHFSPDHTLDIYNSMPMSCRMCGLGTQRRSTNYQYIISHRNGKITIQHLFSQSGSTHAINGVIII